MAGFEVVSERPRVKWYPVANGQTLYVGQMVSLNVSQSGCIALATSSGTPDTDYPFGVIVGTNRKDSLWSSTYNAESIVGVQSQAAQLAVEKHGTEGPNAKVGDPLPMVQVALINTNTILKGRIFNGTYGTVLSEVTATGVTGGSAITTASITTSATFSQTWAATTGLNKGIYRVEATTHATTHTFTEYFPYDNAIGDKFKYVTLAEGRSYAKFVDGTHIDGYVATISAYHTIKVIELKLEETGNEYAIFQFTSN